LYLDRTGCAWRYLPADFPPWQTVYGYFAAWRDDGTLARLHGQLRSQVRTAAGRQPQPTAAVTGLPVGARRRHRAQGHPGLG
jgi:transposase